MTFKTLVLFRMAFGNESGLAIVDIIQKVCLFNVASPDLYGAQDPYSRVPRSPKRSEPSFLKDEQRSPSIDQVSKISCNQSNVDKLKEEKSNSQYIIEREQ